MAPTQQQERIVPTWECPSCNIYGMDSATAEKHRVTQDTGTCPMCDAPARIYLVDKEYADA